MDRIYLPADTDLRALIKAAYNLSSPSGLGCLHYRPGELPDDAIDEILGRGTYRTPVIMDYVYGRAVKLDVHRDEEGRLWIYGKWYDHIDEDLTILLAELNAQPQT